MDNAQTASQGQTAPIGAAFEFQGYRKETFSEHENIWFTVSLDCAMFFTRPGNTLM